MQRTNFTLLLCAAFCRVIFTLLFFSSSNTGLTGRGEGDGLNGTSRGISGSASTTPEIKREGSVHCIQGDETNWLAVQRIIFTSHCHAWVLSAVWPAYLKRFGEGLSLSPCNFNMWYASLIFASSGRDTVQLYSIVITLVFTLSDTLSPRYWTKTKDVSQRSSDTQHQCKHSISDQWKLICYLLWVKWL